MISIVILATSFFVAVVGLIQNNKAATQTRTLLGMTRLGFLLVVVAAVGFIASGAKQIVDSRESARLRQEAEADAKQLRQQTEADTKLLKTMNAKIDYLIGEAADPLIVQRLKALKDDMNLAASRSRNTDFSLSDFTRSRFDNGNFTLTYFPGALFRGAGFYDARFDGSSFEGAVFTGARMKGADFRGLDLSEIIINNETVLPPR